MLPLIYSDNILLSGSVPIPSYKGVKTSQDMALEIMTERNAILANVYDFRNPSYTFHISYPNSIYDISNPIYKHKE